MPIKEQDETVAKLHVEQIVSWMSRVSSTTCASRDAGAICACDGRKGLISTTELLEHHLPSLTSDSLNSRARESSGHSSHAIY